MRPPPSLFVISYTQATSFCFSVFAVFPSPVCSSCSAYLCHGPLSCSHRSYLSSNWNSNFSFSHFSIGLILFQKPLVSHIYLYLLTKSPQESRVSLSFIILPAFLHCLAQCLVLRKTFSREWISLITFIQM